MKRSLKLFVFILNLLTLQSYGIIKGNNNAPESSGCFEVSGDVSHIGDLL
ncbi:MAG: hypothetical protein HRT69_15540 [Flavobacteriaceae bacterium]|nr:hypothetical protein [Flavobacteriaceae bacterium]